MLSYLADGDFVTPATIDAIVEPLGDPGRLPTVKDLAQRVADAMGKPLATDLYARLYPRTHGPGVLRYTPPTPASVLLPHSLR